MKTEQAVGVGRITRV